MYGLILNTGCTQEEYLLSSKNGPAYPGDLLSEVSHDAEDPVNTGHRFALVFEEGEPENKMYKKLADFNGTNGANPQYGQFVIYLRPTAPVLSAETITETSVTLNWTAPTDNVGVTGYEVHNGNILVGSTTALTFTVDNLSSCTASTFSEKAMDMEGNSAISNVVQISTIDKTPPLVPNLLDTSVCSAITLSALTTTDNCAGEITGTISNSLTYDTPGTYTDTWTFDDGNGNTSTATQHVEDISGPEPDFSVIRACLGEAVNFITEDVSNLTSGTYIIKAGNNTFKFVKE